jgi:hypothetical protein
MVLIILCVALSGCCVMTSVDVLNQSKGAILIQTTHTGKAYEIGAGGHKRVPHTSGDLIVTVEGAKEASRVPVSALDYEGEKSCFPRSWPCWRGYLIHAEFTDARGLTVLNKQGSH